MGGETCSTDCLAQIKVLGAVDLQLTCYCVSFLVLSFHFCLQVREASSELVVAALMALLDVAAEDPAAFAAK